MQDPYCQHADGVVRPADRPKLLLPGSFNPLHHGHTGLAAAAARGLGVDLADVAFELSVANVDKPNLAAEIVAERLRQFVGMAAVWVTAAATFAEKAQHFPGTAFIVGYDTAVRLIDPKYYSNDAGRRDAALDVLSECGCRMVVGGRIDAAGVFRVWEGGTGLFVPLTEADFRADVSSTRLRGGCS